MKELRILIVIFIFILVLVASFVFLAPYFQIEVTFNPAKESFPKIETQFFSKKNLYQSNEKVTLTAKFKSNKSVDNVTVHIYGVKDKRNRFIIDQTRNLNLEANKDNSIEFITKLPNYFFCAGVNSGVHQIKLEVIKNNRLLDAATTEINLVSVQ